MKFFTIDSKTSSSCTVKACKTSKWNPSKYIFLYQQNTVTKKVYNSILNLTQLLYRNDHHRLLLNLTDQWNLKRSDKYAVLPNFNSAEAKENKVDLLACK